MAIRSLIAAVAENGVIGKDNDLIWHIPEDLKYFRETTRGKPVIMGRKTFESIFARLGKPLPGRHNIVITRQENYNAYGAEVVSSLEDAYRAAEAQNSDEYFILGGAQIYAEAINDCDQLYITEVHKAYEGDSFFPKIKASTWNEHDRKAGTSTQEDTPKFSFVIYKKA